MLGSLLGAEGFFYKSVKIRRPLWRHGDKYRTKLQFFPKNNLFFSALILSNLGH
jgi:hypothetical protein